MRRVVPDFVDRQRLLPRPARRRVARMSVADESLGANAVQGLQVGAQLLEHRQAARAVHFADVRRDDDAPIPGERDRALHVAADGEQRLRLRPGQLHLAWRAAATDAHGSHGAGHSSKHRVIGRPDDRPVVLQEPVGDRVQAP